MATGDEVAFSIDAPLAVPSGQLARLELVQRRPSERVHCRAGEGIAFDADGWYEVLLKVEWDAADTRGTRFSHTKIPDQEPLHSEAISADVLARISGGRELLRGNSLFGPDRTTSLLLEVWHDSPDPVTVGYAELVVRELHVADNATGRPTDSAVTPPP